MYTYKTRKLSQQKNLVLKTIFCFLYTNLTTCHNKEPSIKNNFLTNFSIYKNLQLATTKNLVLKGIIMF